MVHGVIKPSKQIVALAIVTMAVVVASVVFKVSDVEKNIIQEIKPFSAQKSDSNRTIINEKDSDGDGLLDWEEALWQTDSNSVDTDGDGESDFNEVLRYRQLAEEQRYALLDVSSNIPDYFSDENLSKTEILSRAMFEQAVNFDSAGIPLTQDDAAQLAAALSNQVLVAQDFSGTALARENLSITNNASEEQIHAFGNALGGILKNNPSEENNEYFALTEFMQTGNPATLTKLTPVIAYYESLVARLRATPVPGNIAADYLALINGFLERIEIFRGMQSLSDDSVTTVAVLQAYQTNSDSVFATLHTIKGFLIDEAGPYQDFEDGYLLVTIQ